MRSQYELKNGRPNPYVAKLGAKGRKHLVQWWATTAGNVRLLPPDVAQEFPDTQSTVDALRLVIKLRAVKPRAKKRVRSA